MTFVVHYFKIIIMISNIWKQSIIILTHIFLFLLYIKYFTLKQGIKTLLPETTDMKLARWNPWEEMEAIDHCLKERYRDRGLGIDRADSKGISECVSRR